MAPRIPCALFYCLPPISLLALPQRRCCSLGTPSQHFSPSRQSLSKDPSPHHVGAMSTVVMGLPFLVLIFTIILPISTIRGAPSPDYVSTFGESNFLFSSRFFVLLRKFLTLRLRYRDPGCKSLPEYLSVPSESDVTDICSNGFGGTISSSCFPDRTFGFIDFCPDYELEDPGECKRFNVTAEDSPCMEISEADNDGFYSLRYTPGTVCAGFE